MVTDNESVAKAMDDVPKQGKHETEAWAEGISDEERN